jgi:hypothetical protein
MALQDQTQAAVLEVLMMVLMRATRQQRTKVTGRFKGALNGITID